MHTRWLVTVLALGAARTAAADDIVWGDALHSPTFATLDRYDAVSRGGLDVSYLFLRNTSGNTPTVLRFDAHAQYIDPTSSFGGYAQIPISYISSSGTSSSTTGIGNFELGGLYMPRMSSPDFGIILRGGITLPTGSSGEGGLASFATSIVRLTDLYDAIPAGTSLRLGVSPTFRSGDVFGRADVGLDINIDADGDNTVDNLFRLNAAIGVDLHGASLSAELTNIYDMNDRSGTRSAGERFINEAALAVRASTSGIQPYAAVVIPLDDDAKEIMKAALTIGVDARLR